jgi:hypothetical protein
MRLFVNFFQPAFRLSEKRREGGPVRKRYDTPVTSHQRLIADPRTPETPKAALAARHGELDPVHPPVEIRASGWADDAVLSRTCGRSQIEAAAGAMAQREAFRALPPRRKSVSPFFEAITGEPPSEATPAIGVRTEASTRPPVSSVFTGSGLRSIERSRLRAPLWSEPVSRVAARHGVSGAAVRKRWRRPSIPVPGSGFRRQVETGERPHPAGIPRPSNDNA